ncbi:hypothetical protein T23_13770 [Turicibacter faecis]|uniref:Uncharacterized protein n=1 Tax=Turicibacter faecis TaxID=2963365 RepID=A0ABN6ZHK9_9FIRM|nr:hypothetical protein T23_13770 [Turicibacter sp. TC023]
MADCYHFIRVGDVEKIIMSFLFHKPGYVIIRKKLRGGIMEERPCGPIVLFHAFTRVIRW